MAVRSDRHDREAGPDGYDGVLARVPISADRWAEALPPAPDGTVVTVSFSTSAAMTEHAEAMELLGYRVLDAPSPRVSEEAAWVLVQRDAVDGRRAWWDSVRDQADRVYDLRFGPALRLLEPILRAHLAATVHNG